jgi:hypothetical protein
MGLIFTAVHSPTKIEKKGRTDALRFPNRLIRDTFIPSSIFVDFDYFPGIILVPWIAVLIKQCS